MMYVIINSNVSLAAAIKTLTSARPSWIASKSARKTQIARLGAAQLTTARPLPLATQEEKLKMTIVIQAASARACCAIRTGAPLKNNLTHKLHGSHLQ
jgi:hypothetical protein